MVPHQDSFDTEAKDNSKWSVIKPPSPHYYSFTKIYFLFIISIHSQTSCLRESRHQSLCDASVSAFQVFDWESFAVTVRHYCLQPKNFDSNIEESIISSTSIYFSFIKDGDDDVDTPCWIQLDVLPALEQGQGNVTQGKGLSVMSHKKKVSCSVTQVVEFVTLLVPLSRSAFFAEEFFWRASKFLRDFVRSTEIPIERFSNIVSFEWKTVLKSYLRTFTCTLNAYCVDNIHAEISAC